MDMFDKLLFAVLSAIPSDKTTLIYDDFVKTMKKMGISEDAERFSFLFSKELVAINEDHFIPTVNDKWKIRSSDPIKYVYLTENGKFLLRLLINEKNRSEFKDIKEEFSDESSDTKT